MLVDFAITEISYLVGRPMPRFAAHIFIIVFLTSSSLVYAL